MPAVVLGAALAAVLMRQTRNSMIEVLSADSHPYGLREGPPDRARRASATRSGTA